MLIVRRERVDDRATSRAVHASAFATGEGEAVEAGLLDALREDGFIAELSWVAELDGTVVGHCISTRGAVGDVPALGLGPIGVQPDLQRGGVGTALMRASIGAADALGEPLIALLGDPGYYGRFGFVASGAVGIEPPEAGWGAYFQVLTLSAWTPDISGPFRYAAPFDDLG
ncbi:MAG: N-acetyltransferase [Actinomycetota bacterium]